MKKILSNYYSNEDYNLIEKAFEARNTSQYYVDKIVTKETTDLIFSNAQQFLNKSKDILSKLNEKDILKIRKQIETVINS